MRQQVDDFIATHNYVNYCEGHIYQDGTVERLTTGSHISFLINELFGVDIVRCDPVTREKTYANIPLSESPIEWLVERSGLVAIWYNHVIKPSTITEDQLITIQRLHDAKVVNFNQNDPTW